MERVGHRKSPNKAVLLGRTKHCSFLALLFAAGEMKERLSNVTDYNKVGNTIIAAVNLMNDKITNNPAYSDALLNLNTIEFEVPIQNYLDSNVMTDVIKATITADTIKKVSLFLPQLQKHRIQ